MWKRADLLLAAALVLLSLAALLLPTGEGDTVVIRKDGEEVYRGWLSDAHTVELEGNIVRIEDGEVWMERANCAGQDCVHMGRIRYGQIACIPNNVIVTVENAESEVDVVAG